MFSFFKKKKPAVDFRKFVAIRMEAVGGQGANSAGKIIAEAAVIGMGYTGNHFSSFGSEKRGSPVGSYIRFSVDKKPIRSATHIANPDVLVVFHESLIHNNPGILKGSTERTDVLINSSKSPNEISFPVGFVARSIATIPATDVARKYGAGLNAVMMGALSSLVPEIEGVHFLNYFEKFFSKLSQKKLADNLKAYHFAKKNFEHDFFMPSQASESHSRAHLPEMGWLNAPLGGVIVNPGNTVLKNQSASRKGVVPHFNRSICFDCGFCDMVCPDYCFVWDKTNPSGPHLKGIDYQYCKGCQKCITVCPVQALTPVAEEKLTAVEKSEKLFQGANDDLLNTLSLQKEWLFHVDHLSEKDYMISPQSELLNPNSYLRAVLNSDDIDPYLTENMKNQLKKKSEES